ncbi:hypothetical protein SSX86_004418 [Deinandra increscens subsp. villosa]|uniref:Uncharacterized protein n=1 Tax=Deinandra increscens subsp. villosa TaxID=3103831 RepID=A0AAP0DMY7_9ASTR
MKDVEVKDQVGDKNKSEKEERMEISPEVEEKYIVEKKVRTHAKEGEEYNAEEKMSEEGMMDINRAANKRERLLWQYLMACQQSKKKVKADKDNDKCENDEMVTTKEGDGENAKRGFMRDLFTTFYGLTAKAYVIGTQMPGKKVDTNIVSCWAAVLNFEEAAVEKGQQRLFLYPDTMNESIISEKNTNPKRVEKFENRLLDVVEGDKSLMYMKSFKTIVVPIKDGDHLYIMGFDLDVPAITVIESVHEGISLEDMTDGGKTYASKGTPHKVKHVIWSYLQKVSHPKAMSLSATKPRLLKSTWTTKTEYTDSGVYAMRNMESSKGRTSGFDNGFRNDDKQRETQVQNLRMRYACKLLSSAANVSGERTMKGSETTNQNLQRVSNDDINKAAAMRVQKFQKKLDGEYEKIVKGLEDIKGEEPKKQDAEEENEMLKLKKDVKGKRVRNVIMKPNKTLIQMEDAKTIVKKFLTFRESRPFYFPKGKGFHHSPDDAIVSLPPWLFEDDIEYFASKLEKAGIFGGLNYYRALRLNWELSASWSGAKVIVPTKFITADEDLMYHMSGMKDYIDGGRFKKDVPLLEEVVVMKGVAHFINQERPDEINKHILEFIQKF